MGPMGIPWNGKEHGNSLVDWKEMKIHFPIFHPHELIKLRILLEERLVVFNLIISRF